MGGRRSSGGGREESVPQVSQGFDTATSAARVRQAVSNCAGTGLPTTSQTHCQGNEHLYSHIADTMQYIYPRDKIQ